MTPCRIVFTIGKTSFAFGFPGGHSEDRPEENLAGHAEDTLTGGPARDPVERSETLYTNSNSYMTHLATIVSSLSLINALVTMLQVLRF